MVKKDIEEAIVMDPVGAHCSTVIWLHGLGADGYDFVSMPEALRLPPGLGIRFIFPHAPVREVSVNGNMKMRAWFDISSQDLTATANEQHLDQVSTVLEALIANQNGCPVVLAGFSQGGATALFAGLHREPVVAGILSISGWLPTLPRPVIPSHSPPVLLLHGNEDDIIPLHLAQRSYGGLMKAEPPAVMKTYSDTGHTLALEAIADIRDWLLSVLAPAT